MKTKSTPSIVTGFTILELMVVLVMIGILVSQATAWSRIYILQGYVEGAKPYLMAISAKEQIHYRRTHTYLISDDEQTLQDGLGLDLTGAGNFCFMVRQNTQNRISPSNDGTTQYEVWAVLRDSNYSGVDPSGDQVSVYAVSGAVCITGTGKTTAAGWVDPDPTHLGGEGRVVVFRYPPPDSTQDSELRSGRNMRLVWLNGFSDTDPLL
ncbi:MAG: prepilin-type N-terminal cleavage/methylation domain-containing protein [Magnetococcales bacterium]|nr:prepilin-type N-terminal cleavage/methylation domain-containing protein [Magnetococcales bacterium]MBF0322297.1 prepilin-type N-terminal cleavage/methylation domain-containing protein [Magnetococcales bacterium]